MDPPTLGGEWMEKGGYEPLIAGSVVWEDCVEDNEWEIKVRKCSLFYFFLFPLTSPTLRPAQDSVSAVHICRLNLHRRRTFHLHLAWKSSPGFDTSRGTVDIFSFLLKKKKHFTDKINTFRLLFLCSSILTLLLSEYSHSYAYMRRYFRYATFWAYFFYFRMSAAFGLWFLRL